MLIIITDGQIEEEKEEQTDRQTKRQGPGLINNGV